MKGCWVLLKLDLLFVTRYAVVLSVEFLVNENHEKVNDPAAIRGKVYSATSKGTTAAKAVDDADAHDQLGNMYSKGKGVEKDTNKAVYHWEQAAIRGHPISRYNLAVLDMFNGRFKRATTHWLISACIGHDPSLERLKFGYMRGYVEKDDFAGLFVDTNPLWMQRRVRRGRQQTQPSWMSSQIKDKQLTWRML
ncbi:hypothetical protein QTG54_002210 [Skeletonema marinoi]|uniref:Uncharacterized protein n=1 Tax=Skeletonema marinoi TaxID=267567 RepID=A0AAD8YKQ2_9STRA|nr:hypothetical protein QTG54_002210 [Skeletonema marinoi]